MSIIVKFATLWHLTIYNIEVRSELTKKRDNLLKLAKSLVRDLDGFLFFYADIYCVKSVQIQSFFWSVFPDIRTEYEKTPYLDTFTQ